MSGITVEEAKAYFDLRIPNGTDVYVGLFKTLPGKDGTGGVEADYTDYARVAHQDWWSQVVGTDKVRRTNVGAIEMVALGGGGDDQTIVGWGIWDASTSGNLRHWGPLRDASNNAIEKEVTPGNQIRWTEGTLKIQCAPQTDQTESPVMENIFGPTQTTNATPATQTLHTLTDEESVDIEVTIIGKHTTAGATDYHYRRKILATYFRDDGGSGSQLGKLHQQDADGSNTQIHNLTTATASLTLSGNNIQAQYTGENSKNLDWYSFVKVISSEDL